MLELKRWDIINHLIKKNNYTSYLEIGYYKGWSFDRIDLYNKFAVDPNPCKTPRQEMWSYGANIDNEVIKMTSDEYFAFISSEQKYDIIFIDGLHESQQVDRDIQNALKHLNPGGTIVLHDLNPPTELHTTTGDKDGNWNGDCYKSIINLQANIGVDLYTVNTDWGVGVVKPNPDNKWIPYQVKYYDGTWKYFDEHRRDILNLISPEEFLERESLVLPSLPHMIKTL